jgi:hypothetical protein
LAYSFSNSHRARQEYNNILHKNSSTMQAHFGRSGLHMLSYDPADQRGELYLFEKADRIRATDQLSDDIPRLIAEFGDAVGVAEFYQAIYNMTPAHMDDIHEAIIRNPDLEVITEFGGERRKPNTMSPATHSALRDTVLSSPCFSVGTYRSDSNVPCTKLVPAPQNLPYTPSIPAP